MPYSGKTTCKQGHEFTEENTYVYASGARECRECSRAKSRRLYAAKALTGRLA